MASAAIWLDELGIPPCEVCLDWAWQIQTQFANSRHSIVPEAKSLQWQRIEVSDTGELLLPRDLENYLPDARLQELLNWAHGASSSISRFDKTISSDPSDVENELRRLTAYCVNGFVEVRDEPLPHSQVATSQATETAESELLHLPLRQLQSKTRAKLSSSNLNLMKQAVAAIHQHRTLASIAVVTLIIGCIFVWNSAGPKVASTKPIELSRKAKDVHAEHAAINDSPEIDEGEVLATIPVMPELSLNEPEVRDVSPITMPSVSSSVIAGGERKESESSPSSTVGDGIALIDAMPSAGESPGSHSDKKLANETELAERDVMRELEVVTKSANNAVESDLEMPDVEDASTVSEPFMLHTSPMVQTHKLAGQIKVRPRQPVWQILLSVDDEFELAPNEPQDISDRQVTTWLLSDSESNSPKVRIVIQVQAAPARQTALRWRVFAGSEDLPDLMLPLDKKILDPLQDRLRMYSQVSQREADRLKQLASSAERDVRATLSKQRTFLESQSKLASRVSTIVAEAQLLNDLLRSQLTVYAKLRDGTNPDAPALIQFGDPSELEKVQEESNRPVAN